MHYLEFLRGVHDRLQPETYLELGLRNGDSLALSRCRSVGVDPFYSLTAQLDGDFTVLRTTSDDFFAQGDPLRTTHGRAFDLTFIDGLHLFEYALRDFIHTERHSQRGSVIVFDDVLPRSSDEAARERHTQFWTGDVYKIAEVLARYRPDLLALTVDSEPTGMLVIMGLDPANSTLAENYEQVLTDFRTPDPQVVPEPVLRREQAVDPNRVLASGVWPLLRSARSGPVPADFGALLRAALAEDSEAAHEAAAVAADAFVEFDSYELGTAQPCIVESVDGALLRMPVHGARLGADQVVHGELRLGSLAVPARLSGAPDAVVQAWVSGLPGVYPLGVRFGDTTRDCGIALRVGPAGELELIPAPAAKAAIDLASADGSPSSEPSLPAAPSGRRWRPAARRIPGLVSAVRAARRLAGR